ncbi:V-type ATP synthase subunit D [Nonomuraea harbinensis]|uniref:V-type ATP synthase subunit D n=1 Tax=Nonomuraea harbinensis TaxID=1286938 RepID=A0ABW1C800_9ACTN|nr:V-type ATP synthase subunit D [Nonomuraea harbinensis]
MKIRAPAGRMGRLWLRRRLATARRGIDLLDRRLRILLRERERLRLASDRTARAWAAAQAEAETWTLRAATLAGEQALAPGPPAEITVEWAEVMGVAFPGRVCCRFPDPEGFAASAAVPVARHACRAALEAATRHAAAREALRLVAEETATTTTRIRALRERWVPALQEALAQLELGLDETERAAAVQAARARRGGSSPLA